LFLSILSFAVAVDLSSAVAPDFSSGGRASASEENF
jgi:hypothetical protein